MKENLEEKSEKYEHECEAIGEKHRRIHLEMQCRKRVKKRLALFS